ARRVGVILPEERERRAVGEGDGRRVEAPGVQLGRMCESVGGRIEQKGAALGIRSDAAAEYEAAVDEHRARRVVQVRVCPRPNVLVWGERNRLVSGLRVEPSRLIPQTRLVGTLAVAPVEQPGGVGEQHGVHEGDLWQAGELLPTTADSICAS